jgi:hypothetical protein
MLPFPMFVYAEPRSEPRRASQSSQSSSRPPIFPALCAPSPLCCRGGASASRLFPRFCSGGPSDPCFTSSLHPGPPIPISFTFRTSAKRACNPCRMRSFKTQHLKPFRMCSSEKTGAGAAWHRLQSVLSSHLPHAPAQHAGIRATPFRSWVYFITCGHPGGGGIRQPFATLSPRTAFTPTWSALRRLPRAARGVILFLLYQLSAVSYQLLASRPICSVPPMG